MPSWWVCWCLKVNTEWMNDFSFFKSILVEKLVEQLRQLKRSFRALLARIESEKSPNKSICAPAYITTLNLFKHMSERHVCCTSSSSQAWHTHDFSELLHFLHEYPNMSVQFLFLPFRYAFWETKSKVSLSTSQPSYKSNLMFVYYKFRRGEYNKRPRLWEPYIG